MAPEKNGAGKPAGYRRGTITKRRVSGPAVWKLLEFGNVGGLWPLLALHDLKLDWVTFLKSAIPIADDCRVVNKNVSAILTADESIPLGVIEPFHFSLHFLRTSISNF